MSDSKQVFDLVEKCLLEAQGQIEDAESALKGVQVPIEIANSASFLMMSLRTAKFKVTDAQHSASVVCKRLANMEKQENE